MKNIHRTFRNGKAVYLDDIWFYATEEVSTSTIPNYKFFSKFTQDTKVWDCVSKIKSEFETKEGKTFDDASGFLIIQFLKHAYARYMFENKEEPLWMRALIDPITRHLRVFHINVSFGVDQQAICGWFPYTNFSYTVLGDGMIEQIFHIASLHRLGSIKQLASLRDTAVREINPAETVEKKIMALDFNHTRLLHSYDVCALMTLISHNNLHCEEIKNNIRYAQIAGITHDWRTPAGGDTMKWVDPKTFNEDLYYAELYDKSNWKSFSKRHKIDETYLYEIIQNKGLLGQLLNIADKLAYTARDVFAFVGSLHLYYTHDQLVVHFEHSEGYKQVYKEVMADLRFIDLWKTIKVVDGKLATYDGKKYLRFLKIRALMHKHLYLSPMARFPEYLFSQYIWRAMYKSGVITKEELITKTDAYLFEKTNSFIKDITYFINSVTNRLPCSFSTYTSLEEALRAKKNRERQSAKNIIYFVDHLPKKFKSGLDMLLILKDGKLQRPQDLYKEECAKIEALCNVAETAWLYRVDISRMEAKTRKSFLNIVNYDLFMDQA